MKINLFLKYLTGSSEFLPLELIPAKKLTTKESMDIYLNGYIARLTEVLGEHFQCCWKILGDETFMEICAEYIKKHPSTEWNINRYGKAFPALLASHSAIEDYPFLADLATLEWRKQDLFHKKDFKGLAPDKVPPLNEKSRIKLVSSLEIGTSAFNLPAIFTAAKSEEGQFPDNWEETASWIMYKNDYQVYLHQISQCSYQLMYSLTTGKTLNEALLKFEANAESTQDLTGEVQKLFQWLASNRQIQKVN